MPRRKKRTPSDRLAFPFFIALLGIFILLSFLYIKKEMRARQCANSLSCTESLTYKVENGEPGIFNNQKVSVPEIDTDYENRILGIDDSPAASASAKHIYVNLKTQTLSAYDGDTLFMETPISSGLWGKTPTGDFKIWIKLRSTRMSGGSGADYYNLPNVPYVMYFSNESVPASRGFAIHGAYWHNNFGHAMSHGCINMKETDVAKLYEWATPISTGTTTHSSAANPGTEITIIDGT